MEKASNLALKRRTARRLLRRFALGLGLAFAISPSSATARDNAPSPRRDVRALPPWSESDGQLPPPRPSDSAEGSLDHPAIHGTRRGDVSRLFPRAGRRGANEATERSASMAAHPAGKGRRAPDATIEVEAGDSLWSIAEKRVGLGRTAACWPRIYAANRSTIGPDPDHIEPGQKLELPKTCR
jgi:hypothetical protein